MPEADVYQIIIKFLSLCPFVCLQAFKHGNIKHVWTEIIWYLKIPQNSVGTFHWDQTTIRHFYEKAHTHFWTQELFYDALGPDENSENKIRLRFIGIICSKKSKYFVNTRWLVFTPYPKILLKSSEIKTDHQHRQRCLGAGSPRTV